MSKCKICNSDPSVTGRINSLLETRVKLKLIHEEIPDFSIYQLSRHRNRCLVSNAFVAELPTNAGSDELRVWMQRCSDSYNLAVANGDSRSAIAACSAATRQLNSLHRELEKEALASEKAVDPASPEGLRLTIEGIDALLDHAAKTGDIENGVAPRTLTLLNEEPSFAQIVQAIWADRALLPALLAATTNYLPERVTEHANAND